MFIRNVCRCEEAHLSRRNPHTQSIHSRLLLPLKHLQDTVHLVDLILRFVQTITSSLSFVSVDSPNYIILYYIN